MIVRSDVFVSLLGPTYGSPLPSDAGHRSIVEWEFDTALECRALELLPFVKQLPPAAPIDPEQRAFLDRVRGFRTGSWCKFFVSSSDLVVLVRESLLSWLVDFYQQMRPAQRRFQRFVHRLLIPLAVAAALLSVAAVVTPLFSPGVVVGISALSFSLVAVCGALLWLEHRSTSDDDA